MSDSKVSALPAAATPLDEDWLLKLSKGTPDDLDRRATLAEIRRRNPIRRWEGFTDFNSVILTGDHILRFSGTATASIGLSATPAGLQTAGTNGIAQLGPHSSNGTTVLHANNNSDGRGSHLSAGVYHAEVRIGFSALANGTDAYELWFGLSSGNSGIGTKGNTGAFLEYSNSFGADWQVRAMRNGTASTSAGSVAAVAGWQVARVELSPGNWVRGFINNTQVAEVTSNVPQVGDPISPFVLGFVVSGAGAARSSFVDYAWWDAVLTGDRALT